MNVQQNSCRLEDIQAFMAGRLDADQVAALETHLSLCEWCQDHFDAGLTQYSDVTDKITAFNDVSKATFPSDATAAGNQLWDSNSVASFGYSSSGRLPLLQPTNLLPSSDTPGMIGRLGEFDIIESIGVGGMGVVFKAWDAELHRHVAIKVLSPHFSLLGASRQRFLREAQTAASIVSPYVVPIHAIASHGEIPYLVMSFVPGSNLEEVLIEDGVFSVPDCIRLSHQIALGLAAAHERGLVHRDVKPANVLLERSTSRAWLTDFGLAQAADSASLTHSGLVAGTPNYMSPEQARGESVDARSDLFSFGAVMYTMLTGHPPFRGRNAYEVIKKIIDEEPRSLVALQPSVPAWLDRLVMRLLSKSPSERFPSAKELADILAMCQKHLENPTQHPLPSELSSKQGSIPHRRRVVLASLFALASGFFVLASYGYSTPGSILHGWLPFTQGANDLNKSHSSAKSQPVSTSPTTEASTLPISPYPTPALSSSWLDEDASDKEITALDSALTALEVSELP